MAVADAVFNAADSNQDNRLDINEFRNLVGAGGVSTVGATDLTGLGGAGGYSYSSSYESGAGLGAGLSGAQLVGGGLSGAQLVGGGYSGAAVVGGGLGGASAYESYSSSAGADLGLVGGSVQVVDGGLSAANLAASHTAVQTYETDAQGLFRDHNPTIIRRANPQGGVTYTQNIRVRFLQPPPVPPHGPLVIKEVRPAQPPVPPPLRIRQQAPPLPTPPPLVLRERPPVPPVPLAQQTVVRRLAAVPVPPRSVVIERLPALPRRPRDVVLERWIQYAPLAQRRVLLQRAGPAVQYARPRNVIVQYEQPQARVVRQFQRLGVTAENPALYVQRYGLSLLDASTLLQQARAAGVVEDISPPAPVVSAAWSGSAADLGLVGGAGLVGLGGASSYQSSYSSSADAGLVGGEYLSGGFAGGEYLSSGFAGGEYLSGGLAGGEYLSGGLVGAGYGGASSYGSSYSTSGGVADALFNAADVNHDGVLDQAEFRAAF